MTPEESAILLSALLSLLLLAVIVLTFKVGYMRGQIAKIARALEDRLEEQDKEGADAEQRHSEDET